MTRNELINASVHCLPVSFQGNPHYVVQMDWSRKGSEFALIVPADNVCGRTTRVGFDELVPVSGNLLTNSKEKKHEAVHQ